MCHASKVPTAIAAERAISRENSMHKASMLLKADTVLLNEIGKSWVIS